MKLTVRQVAKLLSVTESEVYRWVDAGEIPCVLVRSQPLFGRAELLEWAKTRRLPVSLDLFEGAAEDGAGARLADALERGGVHHDLPGADRAAVLRQIVQRLPLPEEEDRQLLLQILQARESAGSSGIGDGIAIPHVRSPLVFPGAAALVTLSYLASPIAFDAVDGKPVHTVFTLVSPTIRSHLQLLARLSAVMMDAGFRDALHARAGREAIVTEAHRVEEALARKRARSEVTGPGAGPSGE
jgi:PTS system nitrogen regulatory IIA component